MVTNFGCRWEGCDRHPSKGDPIVRVSPKGEPFEGLCREHLMKDVKAAWSIPAKEAGHGTD